MKLLLLFSLLQQPDPVCFAKYSKNADTLAKAHLASTTLTGYQKRARARLDSLLQLKCTTATAPTSTPTPTPDPTPSVAELPRVVPAFRDPYPGRLCSVTVPSGGDVNAALRAARGGTVVCLASGGTFSNTNLPPRADGDTGWIVVRTSGALPAEGTRVRPSTATGYATLATASADPTLTTSPGTFGWFVASVRITTTAPLTYSLANFGDTGPNQDTMAEVPQGIILSRVVIDGGAASIQRCISLNSGATSIVDSWLMNCHIRGFEGQAIGSWNGPGPHLIRNNYIEAAGINVMWGGATPSIPNLRAYDITVQRNHIMKPLSWKGVWTAKNLLETKNAGRILIEENVFENSWTDAQTGIGVLFKSSNDQGNCSWCQTSDVTYRRNLLRGAETGLAITAGENYCRQMSPFVAGWCIVPGEVPPATARVQVVDNVFDDLGNTTSGSKGIYLAPVHSSTGPQDVVIERNVTAVAAGRGLSHGIMLLSPGAVRAVFRDNVVAHGYYPIIGDVNGSSVFGTQALTTGAPNAVWSGMVFVNSAGNDWTGGIPAGTMIITAEPALAATIRNTAINATAGVVVPP